MPGLWRNPTDVRGKTRNEVMKADVYGVGLVVASQESQLLARSPRTSPKSLLGTAEPQKLPSEEVMWQEGMNLPAPGCFLFPITQSSPLGDPTSPLNWGVSAGPFCSRWGSQIPYPAGHTSWVQKRWGEPSMALDGKMVGIWALPLPEIDEAKKIWGGTQAGANTGRLNAAGNQCQYTTPRTQSAEVMLCRYFWTLDYLCSLNFADS